MRSSQRPRFRVIRECARTAQALSALALDPRDCEKVMDNPAFDAVTAALMLRPLAPERAPHPEDARKHPGLHPSGRRKRPWEKALEEKPDRRTGYRVPRELVPLDEGDWF